MADKVKRPSQKPLRPNRTPVPQRPASFMDRLMMTPESPPGLKPPGNNLATPQSTRRVSEPLSIPPSSESSSEYEMEEVRISEYGSPADPGTLEGLSPASEASVASVAVKADLSPISVEPAQKVASPNDSFIIPSTSLALKARKILERELLFEKLIAQSKAELEILEEQINELGTGYVAVPRNVTSRPPRRVLEMPEDVPSPISSRKQADQKENVTDRSGDETDENFRETLKSTPPASRPPLAPSNRRPLLTNVPLRSNFN